MGSAPLNSINSGLCLLPEEPEESVSGLNTSRNEASVIQLRGKIALTSGDGGGTDLFEGAYTHAQTRALTHTLYVRFTNLLLETRREFDEDQSTTVLEKGLETCR